MSRSASLSLAKLSSAGGWEVLENKTVILEINKKLNNEIKNITGRGSALVMLWNVVVVGRRR